MNIQEIIEELEREMYAISNGTQDKPMSREVRVALVEELEYVLHLLREQLI